MRYFVLAVLAAFPVPAAAQSAPVGDPEFRLQLDTMPTGQLVVLIMRDVMRVPYVIAPDVLADRDPLSLNLKFPRSELPKRVLSFLRSIGLTVRIEEGVAYVARKDMAKRNNVAGSPQLSESPSGAPIVVGGYGSDRPNADGPRIVGATPVQSIPATAPAAVPFERIAIARLGHLPASEVLGILESALPAITVSARNDSEPMGDRIVDRFEPMDLVLRGSPADLAMAEAILAELDRPRPVVAIRAVVFEVRETKSKGSALSILGNLLAGSVSFSNATDVAGGSFFRLATGGLSAAISATRGDGRFEIVAEPTVNALSGSVATLNSGAQVPTVGSVTFTESGEPVRSIVYRDSGISLQVAPVVRHGEIELSVSQERSSFARTETGVSETPTLNKSSTQTTVAIAPGETIAIAGLDQSSDESAREGFLAGLLGSRRSEKTDGQLLILLQADLVVDAREAANGFIWLDTPSPSPDDQADALSDAS